MNANQFNNTVMASGCLLPNQVGFEGGWGVGVGGGGVGGGGWGWGVGVGGGGVGGGGWGWGGGGRFYLHGLTWI